MANGEELAPRLGGETFAPPGAEARAEDLAVVVVDFLHALSQAVMTGLDGIIGYNFLKQFRVTIDYPNETLSFD